MSFESCGPAKINAVSFESPLSVKSNIFVGSVEASPDEF